MADSSVDSAFNEPGNNYAVPQTQPAGLRIPEFAIRQLIGWAIGQVRTTIGTPTDVVDQLFALVPPEARAQFKQWLLQNQNLYLDVSFPREGAHTAMVVVEPQSEAEDTEHTFLNDSVGYTERGVLGGALSEAPAFAVPETRTTNIYVASNDDRLTLLLYTLVKFILVSNKQALTQIYDVHNLILSGGVLDHDSDKLPEFVYYRVLQARYMTLFDYNGPASGPAIVDLLLAVQTVQDGLPIVVNVSPDTAG